MIAPLVFRHASQCLTLKHTKSISLADLMFMIYIHNFAQPPGETSHDYTLSFSTAAAAVPAFRVASSAPEAGCRCIGRLWTATPPWSSSWSLRGPRWTRPTTTAVASEGFSGRFGSGSDEVTEGVRTWAGDFRAVLWDAEWYSYTCCLRIYFLWWDGPLEIRVKEMRWNE